MPLTGRTLLLPGAARAIGRAIARRFADRGARLVLPVYDWPEAVDEMAGEFRDKRYNCLIVHADLRKEEDAAMLAEKISAEYGSLDYLVNNIERGGMPVVHGGYHLPANRGQWDLEFNTSLKAKWLLFSHCYPLMAGRSGSAVVNLSSIAASTGRSGATAALFSDGYSAANRGVRTLTETWARQAAPHTRVNELVLGLVRGRHGEGTRGWACLAENEQEAIVESIPLQRTGLPEEVAEAVYFLAVEAAYITGASLLLDGGLHLGPNRVPPIPPGVVADD